MKVYVANNKIRILQIYFLAMLSIKLSSSYKYLTSTNIGSGRSSFDYSPKITTVPHHVLIVYGNWYCSGSVINTRIVLTTASCLMKRDKELIIVKIGVDSVVADGQIIPVMETKIHEYFGYRSQMDNDIALLVLKDYVIFKNYVKKVILVGPDTALSVGTALLASGWGSSNVDPEYNNKLIWNEMIVMDKDECLSAYDTVRVTPAMFCGKYASNHRLSDNGGPVVVDNILVGITSFGADSERPPFIAVLTNVSYFYRWIKINTESFLNKYCVQKSLKKITDANEYQ